MLAGPLAVGAKVGVAGARALPTATRYIVEPAAVAPGALVRREGVLAVGAGTGAGVANEAVGNPQQGDNLGSDFAGSMVGALGTSTLGAGAGAVRNLASAARGTARFADDVAGEEVVDRIINSSTRMGAQAAETAPWTRPHLPPICAGQRRSRTPFPAIRPTSPTDRAIQVSPLSLSTQTARAPALRRRGARPTRRPSIVR